MTNTQNTAAEALERATIQLEAGDVVRMLTPGGGGWGPADDRWL
jgi:N-methylhydantoinase B/oxoprolinase/acetone carboxylase alpha subunit